MSATPTKNNINDADSDLESINFPNKLAEIMAHHANEDADPMTMGCSNLMEVTTTIRGSPNQEPVTKPLDIQTAGRPTTHQSMEIDGFEHISHAEAEDYARQVKAAPSRKLEDVLENAKLLGWVLAWGCMKALY